MARVCNFNAGPAALPEAVLRRAQAELLDFDSTGMSILEHSHRGAAFERVHAEALELTRELLQIPSNYQILLLQGGASQQFAMVPMNLLQEGQSADYIVTGLWSQKAVAEANCVGRTRIAYDASADSGEFDHVPSLGKVTVDPEAAYVHLTSNNTVKGSQFHNYDWEPPVPVVADMSSDIFSAPLDVSKFALIYAGAQKNLGPSGLVLVIIREDLLDRAHKRIPKIFQYKTHAEANSLYNTPSTFAIYLMREVLRGLKEAGGLVEVERRNREKAARVYAAVAARPDVYSCPVKEGSRSLMNPVFRLPTVEAEARFVSEAAARGLVGLKGHRSTGGVRASIYNAAELAWVDALVSFMGAFRL